MHLSVPRKPAWNLTMSAEEVDRREKDAFLIWRRNIAVYTLKFY
jgi:large subunit GTPase 1